ncbi:hypothetical protein DB30_03462 [Enhygromyxa salina]|uniref:Uncharacterized protein n=1 Tax=Enhygromyxa salina TaxID=215803 RepID=A0A0C1ZIB2_9BACT|nr:hypothetical protein [Enhygromyxa salina]KIG17279.1 hypothetical protein DB30_03462 [Enhygromyxa salina]
MRRQRDLEAWLGVRVAVCVALACCSCERDRQPSPDTRASVATHEALILDPGAVRASVVDGLELAAGDPVLARGLGLAALLEHPTSQAAIERLLARVAADPELTRTADQLFVTLQASPAMRSALVDYAREHPELDVAALGEGLVSHVNARLTRPELATLLEAKLKSQLRATDPALARAFVGDAGGGSAIAKGVVARLEDPSFATQLRARLGRDPAAVQTRLERRLADPGRVGPMLLALNREDGELASAAGLDAFAQILDHERTAELLAAGLARMLTDAQLRERCQALFALALAPSFDEAAFGRALDELLGEPALVSEAIALLAALAREPEVRAHVEQLCVRFTNHPGFEGLLLAALD